MKFLLLALAFWFITNANAAEVPATKARQVAVGFLNDFTGKQITNNDILSVEVVEYHGKKVFYAVNFRNNTGYVIVAADDAAYPVLGYVPGFQYDSTRVIPTGLQNLFEDYSRQIIDIRSRNLIRTKDITTRWAKYFKGEKTKGGQNATGPLLTTIWSQGCYFNDSCPVDPAGPCQHVVTGCVATAMAQTINYHNFPPNGSGTHSYMSGYGLLTADFGNTTYNWSLMADTLDSITPAAKVAAVAQLISHCGIAVDMMYSAGGSGAYSEDAMKAFIHYFNFDGNMEMRYRDNYPDSLWEQMLIYNLDSVGPVYYDGTGTGGHAFVCDGYQNQHYFHYNWGWNGSHNGWFLVSNLNPGGMNFGMYNSGVFGMKPENPSPCQGVTDTLTAPDGNFGDGSSYQNYQNNISCSWLIQPAGAQSINLEFYTMSLGTGDTVKVYDGNSSASPLLIAITGDSIPAMLNSSSGSFFITFTSDTSVTGGGWSASYFTDFCSGFTTFTAPSGTFSDGSGAYLYHNNSDCYWLIDPASQLPVHLRFDTFKTEQGYDFVKVYDGSTVSGTLLGDFSGDSLPPELIAPSGTMLIHFTSDGGMVDEGWQATYWLCDTLPAPVAVPSTSFCSGDSVMIYTNANHDSIKWISGQKVVSTDTSFWVTNGGNYFYTVYRQGCSWDTSSSIIIKENPLPQPSLGKDSSICVNFIFPKPVVLSFPGLNQYSSILWNTGDTTSVLTIDTSFYYGIFDTTITYWVIVTDSAGCSNSDSIDIRLMICGSINQAQEPEAVVFPNPAMDFIYYKIGIPGKMKTCGITDVTGREVYSGIPAAAEGKIDISTLPQGVYVLHFEGDNTIVRKVFIKR